MTIICDIKIDIMCKPHHVKLLGNARAECLVHMLYESGYVVCNCLI